jgi:hypothetical protein
LDPRSIVDEGDQLEIAVDPSRIYLFDCDSGALIAPPTRRGALRVGADSA